MNALKAVEEEYKREKPSFRVGDTISVNMKIKEGE